MVVLEDRALEEYLLKYLDRFFKGEKDFSEEFSKKLAQSIRSSVIYSREPFRTLLNRDFDLFLKKKEDLFVHCFGASLLEIIKEVRRIYPGAFPEDKMSINMNLNLILRDKRPPFLWAFWYSYKLKGFETRGTIFVVSWAFRETNM